MFGRIFGRGKDDQDQAVCADCGRTLLAGEWTQTVVGDDGEELLICSLCGQAHARGGGDALTGGAMPANSGRVRQSRSEAAPVEPTPLVAEPAPRDQRAESDAFWQALKEKDAEIEHIQAQLARAEAERQELAGRFARLGSAAPDTHEAEPDAYAPVATPEVEPPSALTGDSSEPGERTWGETPAEFAAEMAALRETEIAAASTVAPAAAAPAEPVIEQLAAEPPSAEPALGRAPAPAEPFEAPGFAAEAVVPAGAPAYPAAEEPAPVAVPAPDTAAPASVFEDTQPIPELDEESPPDEDASTGEITGYEVAAAPAAAVPHEPGPVAAPESPAPAAAPAAADVPAEAVVPAGPAGAAAEAEAEAAAASLTLLQRGVDLLNVSRVPRKIAETNEQLGLPHVHVGFDGGIVAITFLWTMGWYRFHVDIDRGDVSMSDRGYEERADLRPNAGVRADGTVQLAPAQISRAAAHRANSAPAPAAAPATPAAESEQPGEEPLAAAPAPAAPESPRVAAQKPPEILSKSLLGQRSDDETASWEQTKARDFDWDH